jgi:hypothetical protein
MCLRALFMGMGLGGLLVLLILTPVLWALREQARSG